LNPGVYTADRPFVWNSIDVGGRMTVIELPSSSSSSSSSPDGNNNNKPDLWIHSPVDIDEPTMAAIQKIGVVKHVVSPNYEHLKYAALWNQTFPQAYMWGCPGLMERKDDVVWTGEIPNGIRPKGWKGNSVAAPNTIATSSSTTTTAVAADSSLSSLFWDTDILQPLHLNIEKNPFTGKPFFNEVIFYHAPTKSLIVTDIFWNYPGSVIPNEVYRAREDTWELAPIADEIPFGTRIWKAGMDKVYAPFFHTFMITDQTEFQNICHHILNVWDIETVIPCHGDILRGKDLIRSVLKDFLKVGE
jgi:hypothetical protein